MKHLWMTIWVVLGCVVGASAATFEARDTLDVPPDASVDAQAMLDELVWEPTTFEVTAGPDTRWFSDALVQFDSPKPRGDKVNDRVGMLWYAARDEAGEVMDGPAVLVIHESSSAMTIGRMLAKALSKQKVHAFMMNLPDYDVRRSADSWVDPRRMGQRIMQGIADARRARDAIAALPHIIADRIAIEGTSLGGFVVSSTAALDNAFESVWILVSGGRIDRVLFEGKRDAAKAKRRLDSVGMTESQIREMVRRIEPIRIAHRIDATKTYLYTAVNDSVIPAACSDELAQTIGLAADHHLIIPGDHYTSIFTLPKIIGDISRHMHDRQP